MPEEYLGNAFVETVTEVKSQITDIVEGEAIREQEASDFDTDEFHADRSLVESKNSTIIRGVPTAGPHFFIRAAPGYRYFVVESSYDLVGNIKDKLDTEDAQDILTEYDDYDYDPEALDRHFHELEEEDMMAAAAAITIVDTVQDETTEKLVYHLVEAFTTACVKHHIGASEVDGGITGFRVYYKIFPYEEAFSIQELNRTIEQVRLATHYGQLFLQRSFNLSINQAKEDETGAISPDPSPP